MEKRNSHHKINNINSVYNHLFGLFLHVAHYQMHFAASEQAHARLFSFCFSFNSHTIAVAELNTVIFPFNKWHCEACFPSDNHFNIDPGNANRIISFGLYNGFSYST